MPTSSPLYSIGALSFSPSPITTTPAMLHRVEHQPHRVDGGLVGCLLVAAADPAAGAERRRLGHADELEREVAVGRAGPPVVRSVGGCSVVVDQSDPEPFAYIRSGASTPTRSRLRAMTSCVAGRARAGKPPPREPMHAVVVVEAVEVVGEPDGVGRGSPAARGAPPPPPTTRRELGEPLDQVPLLGCQLACRVG